MKKIAAVIMLALVVAVAVAPAPAEAWRGGRFWPGFAIGTASGFVFGSVFAPRVYPPAVYYAPPVYYAPAPRCYTTYGQGYWATVPVPDASGNTTYQYQFVPGQPQTVCR